MSKTKEPKRYKLAEKLPISEGAYHALVGILIGIGIGIIILLLIALATRDSRPTQYILQLILSKIGL